METPRAGRSSFPLTPALGVGFLIVALVFAFESGFYGHWYALFRLLHVVLAVIWVGGGVLLTVLALRAQAANDPGEIARIASQAAFAGERIFAPAGGLVFLTGIAMMINTDWGWGKFWVDLGLLGYAATFTTGLAVLTPMAKRVSALVTEQGSEAAETQEAIRKILLVVRIDITVLLIVVADMVTKPFS